jgi:lipopolysaccharide export system protein LptA
MRPSLLKNIRRSLIGIIILVLLAVIFNYMHIGYRRARSVQKAAQILSSEIVRSFHRFEDFQNKNGIARFKVSAQRVLVDRHGKNYLEGVEAYDFNPDGSIHNEIRSRKAEYDKERKLADFSGDVRLFFGKGVELRMNSLHYDFNANVGTTEDKFQFLSDMASGSARGIRYDKNQGSLDLKGEVDFVLTAQKPDGDSSVEPEKFHASSDRAFCSDQMNRIVFQGRARIDSKSDVLSGDNIEAALGPERKQVTSLISTGNALYQSGDSNQTQTLRGDRMVFGIGDLQSLEKINVTGQAEFLSVSPMGEEILRGGEIDLAFDTATGMPNRIQGRNNVSFSRKRGSEQMQVSGNLLTASFISGTNNLESIHVEKQAFMSVQNDAAAMRNELQAAEIRMSFRQSDERMVLEKLRAEGSARWVSKPSQARTAGRGEPARTLTASWLEMFYSREGDSFESGSAAGGVVISESRDATSVPAQTRRLLADNVQFHFFPGNNRLRDMDAEGHVKVIQEKKAGSRENSAIDSFRTDSDKMKVIFYLQQNESAVESIAQWGNFRYEDASTSATAGRCDYDARKEMLTLRDSPGIRNEMNSTTGKWMEYEQKAGILSVHGQVRSLLSAQKGKGSFFTASSSSSQAIVTADEMKYWTTDRRARYTGKVQLLSENGHLQAGQLDIVEGGESVEAKNGIRHYFIPERGESESPRRTDKIKDGQSPEDGTVVIRSSSLKYLRESNRITYLGAVTAHSEDMDMSSESLEVVIASEGGNIEHATARGKVIIRQGPRECKGEKADYFLDRRKFVLIGNPAEVNDPQKGRSFASQLTYFIADDRILLENK